jgi:hypothetical protein
MAGAGRGHALEACTILPTILSILPIIRVNKLPLSPAVRMIAA